MFGTWLVRRGTLAAAGIVVATALPLAAQTAAPAADRVDLDALYRIKEEGFQHSQVMRTESYLTDVYGPLLTNSPNIRDAAQWATQQLKDWGLVNVHLESWGPFGRGWSNERFSAQMVAPRPMPLIAYPGAWTPSVGSAPVTAEAVMAVIDSEPDFARYKGTLKGKFVLARPALGVAPHWDPAARRWTDSALSALARQPEPYGGRRFFGGNRAFNEQRMQFYASEGVAAVLYPGSGDDGTVFGTANGPRDPAAAPYPPTVTLAAEHYGRIARLLALGVPVTLRIDDENKFYDTDQNSFNLIAEIPGTDKADEVVMLGGHVDSWHWGTGAADNAAGSAVMMEAVRILKATGLKMRRTVRLALWTGEEQGLLGSRAYVNQHFGDPETMQLKPEHAKTSGYFNVDNGTGRIRGVYLQGNEAVAPVFAQWMEPFRNLGMTTLAIRNTGGTDHLSFDAVGVPGFQFIQDPIDYGTRVHHSNMDLYERVQPFDMMQNAVIVATFVYQTANRDGLLPRKALPQPRGGRGGERAAGARERL